MNIVNHTTIQELVRRAVFAHKKFKHKLIIKITNPSDIGIIQHIKEFQSDNVVIDIEYKFQNPRATFHKDIENYHVGLVIVSKEAFKDDKTRKMLYDAHVPVLKIANRSFSAVRDAVLILSQNRDLEKVSTTIFDISAQMGFNIELYSYLSDNQEENEQVIEHYKNLSTIFSKSIKATRENKNPLLALRQRENFIHILPFTNKLTSKRLYSLLSTDSEKLSHKLDEYHQIFIPLQL